MSLKEVKNRINSVKSTRQITSAMKMVASAKLHKAEERINSMVPYQQQLNRIVGNFLGTNEEPISSPYVAEREVHRIAVVAFSSNTSLCGAFNSNVLRSLNERMSHYASLGHEALLLYPVGKKVEEAVRKWGYPIEGSYLSLSEKPTYAAAAQLAHQLMQRFASGEVDRVELIYHHFKSKGTQVLMLDTYLPLHIEQLKPSESTSRHNYIVEPSMSALIAALLPKMLTQKIYTVALDSNASEHAARTLAMQTATDNANELLRELTQQYNKSRQQAITNELLDIIGGTLK